MTTLHGHDALAVAAAVPAGLWVADFVSAVAHWVGDTFFDSETPLLGVIIEPFRLHHDDPQAFRRHDFLQRNRNNCLAVVPLLALVYFLPPLGDTSRPFWGAMLASAAITLAGATQIHAWAHDDDAPRAVRRLQRWGILLSAERHACHHRGAHDRSYGIVNGWANGLLDRTRFFRRTETFLAHLGLRPSTIEEARRGSPAR